VRTSSGERGLLAGPVTGKTYSLYGQSSSSDRYFDTVAGLVDLCLQRWPDGALLVAQIAGAATSSRRLASARPGSAIAFTLEQAAQLLGPFLLDVDAHRAELSLWNRLSATLAMRREQYLLCAVEIELRNRRSAAPFGVCKERIALLPHCLRDLDAICAAEPHGLDAVCMACSRSCYVNEASRLLRRHRIRPYVWMNADLSRLLREKARSPGTFGVLGIACIPELVAGMRRCARAGVPALGLPLDANRCSRWFGELRQNTIHLARLERLVAGG